VNLRHSNVRARACRAFSLLEVMIAAGIFFMAAFAILELVSQGLRGAKALQKPPIDVGMAAAVFAATNRFYDGKFEGEFDADPLRDYSYVADVYEAGTNGLLAADIVLEKRGLKNPFDKMSVIIFDPNFRPRR